MRFPPLMLAAALALALPASALQAKTFRWTRAVDVSSWDIHPRTWA